LKALGDVACHGEDAIRARTLYIEALHVCQSVGYRNGTLDCLLALADLSATRGQAEEAARLLGAVVALRDDMDFSLPPLQQERYDATIVTARAALGGEAFAATWVAGRRAPLEQVIADAVGGIEA